MNTDSCDCHRVALPEGFNDTDWANSHEVLTQPGQFYWLRRADRTITELVMLIPGNEGGSIAPIPVKAGEKDAVTWQWDGNEEKPTLKPSIWRNRRAPERPAPRNEWHGHLVAGRLVSC